MTPKKKAPTAAAVYARLSQDRSGESLGIARQADLCEKLAAERGWPVAEVYEERNVSAYNGATRPSYRRLLADIESGRRDAVIAVDQDRLARRLSELLTLIELCAAKRVPIVLLSGELDTTTADGVLRAQILGAVAQNESAKKSERIRRQREQAAARGAFTGGKRPYGFEPDGVTHRRDEAKIIRECTRRLLSGESLRSVAMDLNARNIPAAKGGPWRPKGLSEVIVKPRFAGLRVHHGEVVGEAAWKAIIDRATHEKLVAMLTKPGRTRRGRPPEHLLSGLCRCGKCDHPLWHATVNGVRAYRCGDKSAGGCNGTTIVAEPVESLVAEAVLQVLENSPALSTALAKPIGRNDDVEGDDLGHIEHDLAALAEDFGTGRITRGEWLAAREPLERRRGVALAAVESSIDTAPLLAFGRGRDVRAQWDALTLDQRRAVIRTLIDKVEIAPATQGTNAFDRNRVKPLWRA